jgi:hypothetical protein
MEAIFLDGGTPDQRPAGGVAIAERIAAFAFDDHLLPIKENDLHGVAMALGPGLDFVQQTKVAVVLGLLGFGNRAVDERPEPPSGLAGADPDPIRPRLPFDSARHSSGSSTSAIERTTSPRASSFP